MHTTVRAAGALIALLAALSSPCFADYSPLQLFDMLGTADVVAVGKITKLDAESYQLEVEHALAGATAKQTLTIQRFQDWTCASRYAPYAVGETLLVCARRYTAPDAEKEVLRVCSGGGEGEMPVVDGKVRLRGLDAPQGEDKLVPVAQVVRAVRGFRRCFKAKLERESYPRLVGMEQTGSAEEVTALYRSSELAARLVTSAKAFAKQTGN